MTAWFSGEEYSWMHKTMDSGINLLNYQFWLLGRISSMNSANSKVGVWKVLFRWFSSSFQTMSTRMERWMPQILPWSEEFPEKIWGNSWAYSCPALCTCRPRRKLCLRGLGFPNWGFGGSLVLGAWWYTVVCLMVQPRSGCIKVKFFRPLTYHVHRCACHLWFSTCKWYMNYRQDKHYAIPRSVVKS